MKRQNYAIRLIASGLTLCFLLLCAATVFRLLAPATAAFSARVPASSSGSVQAESLLTDRTGYVLTGRISQEQIDAPDADRQLAVLSAAGDPEGRIPGARSLFASLQAPQVPTLAEAIRTLTGKGSARSGNTLSLTLDAELSAEMVRSFLACGGKELRGAAVMMNWRTGEVLGMVSLPLPDLSASPEEEDEPAVGKVLPDALRAVFSFMLSRAQAEEASPSAPDNEAAQALFPAAELLRQLNGGAGFPLLSPLEEVFAEPFPELPLPSPVLRENDSLLTPVHVCLISCGIASSGTLPEPRQLLRLVSASGTTLRSLTPASRPFPERSCAESLQAFFRSRTPASASLSLMDLRTLVCTEPSPAGSGGQESPFGGTASSAYGWFLGYNAQEDLPLALCVMTENAADPGQAALEIGINIFSWTRNHPQELCGSPVPADTVPSEPSPSPVPREEYNTNGL